MKVLIAEMRCVFSLENLSVLRAMNYFNPDKIPKENEEHSLDYGKNISTLYNFHGKQRRMILRADELLVCLY